MGVASTGCYRDPWKLGQPLSRLTSTVVNRECCWYGETALCTRLLCGVCLVCPDCVVAITHNKPLSSRPPTRVRRLPG